MITWDEFRHGVPNRLLLSLDSYRFSLSFVPFQPAPGELNLIRQQIINAAVAAIRKNPEHSLSALAIPEAERSLFFLGYGHPTHDFSVQLNNDSLTIAKTNFTVEDLVLTLPLIVDLCEQLFSPTSKYSLAQHDFFNYSYRTSHHFVHNFTLGSLLSDGEESTTNLELMGKFFSKYDAESVIGWLNPDQILRNDIEVSVEKLMGGRPANLWIAAQAPYSIARRELFFRAFLMRGATPTAALIGEDLREFEFVFKDFYRDVIVDRIFRKLFDNIAVTPAYRGD